VGDEVKFSATGSIGSTKPDWPNFAVGLLYHDGPVDSIKVIGYWGEYDIKKGWVLHLNTKKVDPGTTLSLGGKIKFESTGKYELAGVAGYVDGEKGGFIIDSSDPKTVEVFEPVLEFVGIRIPWWILAIAGACVAIATVAGVALYMEHKREMELLMMLLSTR
jgi:hypothetical protein